MFPLMSLPVSKISLAGRYNVMPNTELANSVDYMYVSKMG